MKISIKDFTDTILAIGDTYRALEIMLEVADKLADL